MAAPIQLDRTEGALRGLPADGGVPATLAPVRGKAFPLRLRRRCAPCRKPLWRENAF